MQQFDTAAELPQLLAHSDVSPAQIARIGRVTRTISFAGGPGAGSDAPQKTEQMYDSVLGNLAQLLTHLGPFAPAPELGRLVDWTHDNAHDLESDFPDARARRLRARMSR